MMLIIFSCFMLRYLSKGAFAVAVLITIIFSLPRVMIGGTVHGYRGGSMSVCGRPAVADDPASDCD